ncbi:MAG: hypothetical protein ABFS28_08420 [Bacteroidota bacterium]
MLTIKAWKRYSSGLCSIAVLWLLMLLSLSCEQTEGRGGTGSVSGTLMEHFYNDDFSSLIFQKPAVDEEIFILYGEEKSVGDRVLTGVSGEFRFKYLYPGTYYVYYRTRDSTAILDMNVEKVYEAELDKGEDLDLGELQKLSILDYDEGGAVIRGVVKEIAYDDESVWPDLVIDYIDFAFEQEVYLTYGNHTFYDDRIRTQHDGSFEFSKLIPGKYLIFLYSDDVTGETDKVVIKKEVNITEMEQVVDLGEITIEKI